jgi:hypothetical protein
MVTTNKRTSLKGEVDPRDPFETQGRLFDFDIDGLESGVDGARLKSDHTDFLNSILARIGTAANQNLTIRIGGSADTLGKTGGFDNSQLSARRAAAVRKFLEAGLPRGVNVTFDVRAFGDDDADAADGADVDDKFFRAVDVALIAPGDPDPVAPKRPRQPTPPNRRGGEFPRPDFALSCVREFEMPRSMVFSVRLDSTVTVGNGAQILFSIRDDVNRLEARYRMFAANFGVPDAGLDSSETQLRSFSTSPFPTRVTEFTGARITVLPDKPATISFNFPSDDGKIHSVKSDLDLGGQLSNTPRVIVGVVLTMESTCGQGVRGAEKFGRSRDAPRR